MTELQTNDPSAVAFGLRTLGLALQLAERLVALRLRYQGGSSAK
ncbi:MAG: hypothetical protein AB7I38_18430 [Dehalococcoidia bacterium]